MRKQRPQADHSVGGEQPPAQMAMPVTGKIGKAPRLGRTNAGELFPFYKAPDYKQNRRRISKGRDGDTFSYNRSGGNGASDLSNFNNPGPMVTDTIGWPTNHVISIPRMARSFIPKFQGLSRQFHIVITQKEKKPVAPHRPGGKADKWRYTMYNIPMWNYDQQRREKMPETRKDVKTADEVWRDWSIDGVARNEEGLEVSAGHFKQGTEAVTNVTVRGQVLTFNIWGNHVKKGTELWLILKKPDKPLRGEYMINVSGEDVEDIGGVGTRRTDIPWQLYPWSDPLKKEPSDSDLCCCDEFGYKLRGKAIYIGRAERAPDAFNGRALADVYRSTEAIVSQPSIFIYVDPDFMQNV